MFLLIYNCKIRMHNMSRGFAPVFLVCTIVAQ